MNVRRRRSLRSAGPINNEEATIGSNGNNDNDTAGDNDAARIYPPPPPPLPPPPSSIMRGTTVTTATGIDPPTPPLLPPTNIVSPPPKPRTSTKDVFKNELINACKSSRKPYFKLETKQKNNNKRSDLIMLLSRHLDIAEVRTNGMDCIVNNKQLCKDVLAHIDQLKIYLQQISKVNLSIFDYSDSF